MKKLFVAVLAIIFTVGLSACGEEMCEGKGGIEVPCSELNAEPNLLYLEAGTHVVGTDIEAGIYLFQVNAAPGTIARKDSSDQDIASASVNLRTYIEVKASDAKVEFNGGILWPIADAPVLTGLTVWNEAGYLVGSEIEAGDYLFKMEPGETTATLQILSAVDFETGSIIQTYTTTDVTTGDSITIPASAYAIYIENGHLVAPE
jgi:hypothetical protein